LRRRLRARHLEPVLAANPHRAPAEYRARRGSCAGVLLARAHVCHGRRDWNACQSRIAGKATVTELPAIIRAPAKERAIRANGACVSCAGADLRPPKASRNLRQSRAGKGEVAYLAAFIRAPAEGLSDDGDCARMSRSRADQAEFGARLHRLRLEAAAVRRLLAATRRVEARNGQLTILVVAPAERRAARLDSAGVLDADADRLPVALPDVIEDGKSPHRRRRFRACEKQPDRDSASNTDSDWGE